MAWLYMLQKLVEKIPSTSGKRFYDNIVVPDFWLIASFERWFSASVHLASVLWLKALYKMLKDRLKWLGSGTPASLFWYILYIYVETSSVDSFHCQLSLFLSLTLPLLIMLTELCINSFQPLGLTNILVCDSLDDSLIVFKPQGSHLITCWSLQLNSVLVPSKWSLI